MTSQEEKYLVATQGDSLNTLINLHAESRANKELLILLAKKLLTFEPGQSADGYWKAIYDAEFASLRQQSQEKLRKLAESIAR